MKIEIDFDVLPSSPRTLRVYDASEWLWAEDKDSYIQITPPGSVKCTTLDFFKTQVNSYDAEDLSLGCNDLPDGIYILKVLSFFEEIDLTKYYLKTDNLELNIAKSIIEANEGNNVSEAFKNTIFKIKWLLELANSYIKEGNYSKAANFFKKAKSISDSLKCEKCHK